MRWVLALVFAAAVVGTATAAVEADKDALASAFAAQAGPPAQAGAPALAGALDGQDAPGGEDLVTVMSRNLYLGADISAALDLLPDLPAAADFMWRQVRATDFSIRAGLIAQEAAAFQPAVIGLQEATRWLCTSSLWARPVPVYDFTQQLLQATAAAGTEYVVAEAQGRRAANPGYRIGPLPWSTVTDPATFQPLFGSDSANCGFEIGDTLLVRSDLASEVRAVGTSEYDAREVIVPTVLSIDRGYAWADIAVAGTVARFVTTHLESRWRPGAKTTAAIQAQQLVADLAPTTGPLVVMGDFNSDYRDPRPPGAPNPADQPVASAACPEQVAAPAVQSARDECSPYWIMRKAGFISAGPDDFDPAYFSYGASALLAGPDPQRLAAGLQMGNPNGFTDRLDYVFVRNGVTGDTGETIGSIWPNGPQTWACNTPEQVDATAAAGEVLTAAGRDAPPPGSGICLPSDHAGLVVSMRVDPSLSVAADPPPTEHDPFRLVWWHILLGLLAAVLLLVRWRLRARRRRRAARAAAAQAESEQGEPY